MNFAYIDTRSLLESVLTPPPTEPLDPIPCELNAEWKSFEAYLADFKMEFAKARIDYATKHSELNEKKEEINVYKMLLENIASDGLKQKLEEILDKHESEEGLSTLTLQCREAMGKVEAMKKVLHDTNAERYAKFTCFVCMDRLIDLCFDPCGHVICERCWSSTRSKTTCPGCRTRIMGARKIFTMC
jgi:Zinc finger, C3HC4 type (RING finger)